MSTYFLISRCWNAIATRLGQDPDAPHALDEVEEREAIDSLGEVLTRYEFIRSFVRRTDGSCNARDFELAFITISPPESVDLATFRATAKGFLSKTKCIKRWFMAFEQRGTVESHDIGRGMHLHLLCDVSPPTTFANFKRAVCNAFRGWYTDIRPKLYDWEAGKIEYLKGLKSSDKLDAVEGDRAWRADVGLDDFYSENWK